MMTTAANERTCQRCGARDGGGARFCGACDNAMDAAPAGLSRGRSHRKICPGCQKLNDAQARFCFDCGVQLPEEAVAPLYEGPAGFWLRVLANLIDMIPLWVLVSVLGDRLGIPEAPETGTDAQRIIDSLPGALFNLSIHAIYYTTLIGSFGATLGKWVLRLRVVRMDGGRLTYGLSFMRWFAEIFSLVPLGLGYLWIALSPSKRAWHDYLCDTRVMRLFRK